MAYPTYSPGAGARASWSWLGYIFLVVISALLVYLVGTFVLHMNLSDFVNGMNVLVTFFLVLGLAALLYLVLAELVKHAHAKHK
jgi:hypothetical protein